jgi:uncharacterized OB-fold protein
MSFDAHRCLNGHVTYPGHTVCPECGEEQTETADLSDETGEVVTWPLGQRCASKLTLDPP